MLRTSLLLRPAAPPHLLPVAGLKTRHKGIAIDELPSARASKNTSCAVDKKLLKRVHEWGGGRPMMLSEFFWSSPCDSGLTGGRELKSQQARGHAYRNYVEQAASLCFIVGIEWSTLIDQAKQEDGSANTAVRVQTPAFSVTDSPWKPMLEEMAKTNHGIYDMLLCKRDQFSRSSTEATKPCGHRKTCIIGNT